MSSESGTHRFGEFTSDEAELDRLERQATVAWDLERRVLLEAGLKPGMRVLDLACGPGFISSRIAETVQPGGTVTGVDVNDHLMAIVTSEQIGMRTLLDITAGFKIELVLEEAREAARAQLDGIYEHALNQGVFGQVGAFFTSASKP